MHTIPLWKVVFLGVVQGLTEFLPISSSAHLVIFQQYLHMSHDGSFLMAFDIALHVGTLGALLFFFYHDLRNLFADKKGLRILLMVGLATVPAAIIGGLLKDFFEILFADMISASFFLLLTGWILWFTKKERPEVVGFDNMKPKHALLVGLAQAAAILPGISRSGSTIAAGLLQKFKPETAVRFSFLMAIPAIAGATVLEADKFAAMEKAILFPMLLGALASFVTGYVAIKWMLDIVGKRKLHHFSWYCWVFGGFVFVTELFF